MTDEPEATDDVEPVAGAVVENGPIVDDDEKGIAQTDTLGGSQVDIDPLPSAPSVAAEDSSPPDTATEPSPVGDALESTPPPWPSASTEDDDPAFLTGQRIEIRWRDGGMAYRAQDVSGKSADYIAGLMLGLLFDGRNREARLVDGATGDPVGE